jgi:ABC-type transporter Mla subunit MlaD
VQVGGRRIGSVQSIDLTDDNRAAIKISVQEPYAPLREGTTAVIRLTSLSGVANRYVALTPAPGDAKELPEGATLTFESTTDVVDLDQIFNTLDERTRGDLADVIKGFAVQYGGKGAETGESIKYFNPVLSSSRQLVQQVTEDEGALTRFLVNSSRAVTTIAEKRNDLSALVANTNATASAIGEENAALARALGLLPTDAAARQHDVREPARHARRPRRPGRRVQAGHEGPRAVPARAAPAAWRPRCRRSTTCAWPCDGAAPTTISSRRRRSSRNCRRSRRRPSATGARRS